jgi:hypothetical protein
VRRLALAALALLASPLAAQSTKVVDPSTGQPVFSSANPARVAATGPAASGTTAAGNPVPVGATYNSTLPTFTNGQRGDLQIGARGSLAVTLFNQDGTPSAAVSNTSSDGQGSSTVGMVAKGFLYAFNGTSFDRLRGDTNALSVSPAGLSSTYWSYTSGTSPILSNTTTAVTIKSAAGAAVKNYLDSCEIGSTALGASVPFAVKDGSTVIWAARPPTTGWLTPFVVHFVPPLVGTANTAMSVATTTADTSGTFDVNCQGHTGS